MQTQEFDGKVFSYDSERNVCSVQDLVTNVRVMLEFDVERHRISTPMRDLESTELFARSIIFMLDKLGSEDYEFIISIINPRIISDLESVGFVHSASAGKPYNYRLDRVKPISIAMALLAPVATAELAGVGALYTPRHTETIARPLLPTRFVQGAPTSEEIGIADPIPENETASERTDRLFSDQTTGRYGGTKRKRKRKTKRKC